MIARVHGHAALRQPDRRLARRRVRVSAAREGRGRSSATCEIGERVIEGQIKERGEARRTYETAKAEGPKATLVEQERPNMFTTNVAQHRARTRRSSSPSNTSRRCATTRARFALRFPMAITPRYIPGTPVADGDVRRATGRYAPRPTPFPTPIASRRRSSYRGDGYVNPVTIAIDLDAGFAAREAGEHVPRGAHRGSRRQPLPRDARRRPVPAARDFELVWTPDVGAAPGAALFTEQRKGGKTYALLMVLPPAADATPTDAHTPREITYIVDTSGSMEGVSMDAGARSAPADRARPPAAGRPLQRHRIQFRHAHALFARRCRSTTATLAGARSSSSAACAPAAAPRCCPR